MIEDAHVDLSHLVVEVCRLLLPLLRIREGILDSVFEISATLSLRHANVKL